METINTLMEISFLGSNFIQWSMALLAALVTYTALRILRGWGLNKLRHLTNKTGVGWDDYVIDALNKTKFLLLLIVSLFAGSVVLSLPASADTMLQNITVIAFLIQAGLWTITLYASWLVAYRNRNITDNPAAVTSMTALGFVVKLLVWAAVLLLALDNMGVDITALVAGLGVGGVAVALAVQNILGDLFASMTIVLDKPFVVGDFLIVDQHLGSVENIGLKTTRLRSLSGEQLIFSNSDLLSARLRNYGRMFERRVVTKIGVVYETPREKLQKIPQLIRQAVSTQSDVRFDRAHFMAFGAYSLDFEYVYYVLKADYNIHMDIQQAILFKIHELFEKEGIEFAFPTQTLYVEKSGTEENVQAA